MDVCLCCGYSFDYCECTEVQRARAYLIALNEARVQRYHGEYSEPPF